MRSGSSFHGEDEYWTSGYQAPVDRTMVLKVSELDGRAFRYRIDFGKMAGDSPACQDRDPSESFGPNSCSACPTDVVVVDPVNTRTGNLHMPLPGLGVPGRGLGLGFALAYNSLAASSAGNLGYGWSSTLDMAVRTPGSGRRTVVQEGGATVPFVWSGGGWVAPARLRATLVEHGDGSYTFERNGLERFAFAAGGRLEMISDRNGNDTDVVYPNGTSTEASYLEDEAGRRLSFAWSSGRLSSVTDQMDTASGGPRSLSFSYANGDLTGYVDEAGKTWTMIYDGSHRMVTLRSPRFVSSPAKAIENHYDGDGRVLWQENELDERTTLSYGSNGQTTVTDPEGNTSRYDYVDGRLMSKTVGLGTSSESTTSFVRDGYSDAALAMVDGRGQLWRYEIDDAGNRIAAEDPLGRITRWEYNGLDQVTKVSVGEVRTSPTTTSTAAQVSDTASYDSNGNLLATTRAAGTSVQAITTFVHGDSSHPEDVTSVVDARSKTWTATYASGTGYLTAAADPLGRTTTWGFNNVGWLTSTVSAKGNASGATPADYRTVFERNGRGQLTQATNPLGDLVRLGYDDDGNVTSTEAHLSASDSTAQVTANAYDDAGRLTATDEPGTGSTSTEYDGNGAVTAQVNEAGARTEYTYDPLGRPETMATPAGKVTRYGYDKTSNLTHVTQPGSGSTCTAAKLNCITLSYDAAGQQSGIDYSDPATPDVTPIEFDPLGRKTAATSNGHTETWAWDAQSRLSGHVDANGRFTGYGYDPAGNMTSITYPGTGKVLNRAFDDAGHLASVTDWSGRVTSFGYDANSNWTQTNFPSSTNVDVRAFDRADQLNAVTWKRGASTLGSLAYGARDPNGLVTSVTAAGAGVDNNSWGYDDRNRLTSTTTEDFGLDAVSNLFDADGVRQVFDTDQQLCWTSPTATSGSCGSPTADATSYDYDARGNRAAKTLPTGTTTTYGYDAANRLTTAQVPNVFDPDSRQFQLLAGGAARVADGSDGTGTCDASPCGPFTASTVYDVDIAGQGGVPATAVTAVTGTITVTDPDGDGWLSVNADGDASAGAVPLVDGQIATGTFTARLDATGAIQVESDVDATVAIDITGYWTPPPAWLPALNYWPVDPALAAQSTTGTGTCNGTTCGTLAGGTTEVTVAGVGGVPTGASAVSVTVIAQHPAGGTLRLAPNGEASAGELTWDSAFPTAAGTFTVPVNANGTIAVAVTSSTNVIISVTGYWKPPTTGDTGLGLHVLAAPERLIDTRDGTGTCNHAPCDQIGASTNVTVDATGHAAIPTEASAVMVSVNLIDPTAAGLASIGPVPAKNASAMAFTAGETVQASFITPLSPTGTINIATLWAATDVTIDVIGYFTAPTSTYHYTYDSTGLRTAKTLGDGTTGGGWRNEYTWNRANGLPLLLSQHSAAGTSYLIYGPNNTPIYQITTSGDVMYYHQDHLGSTRLTTNANGTTRGTLTYTAYGTTRTNTNPTFAEQPLLTYTGEFGDSETGLIYLRARYLDPRSGQFITRDPIVSLTSSPFSYAWSDPLNTIDPTVRCI